MKRRVLLIDDDDLIREITELTLVHIAGYEVDSAASGETGIRAAHQHLPDAVLLDVMMPGLDGPSTLEYLRADPVTRDVPVVFMTAKLQPAERSRFERLGVAGVIAKPFDPQEMVAEFARLLSW